MGKKLLDTNRTYHTRDGKVTGVRVRLIPDALASTYIWQIAPDSCNSSEYDYCCYDKYGRYYSDYTDHRDLIADPIVTQTKSKAEFKTLKASDIREGDYVTVRMMVAYVNCNDTISVRDDDVAIADIISHEKIELKVGDVVSSCCNEAKILFITEDKKVALIEYLSGFYKGTREAADIESLSK